MTESEAEAKRILIFESMEVERETTNKEQNICDVYKTHINEIFRVGIPNDKGLPTRP